MTVHVSDDEAEQIWIDQVGFPAERIQRLDKDNFWEMGDTGPCGPARSSSSTAAPRGTRRRPANPPPRTATSRSGTWCSSSTTGRRRRADRPAPTRNIDTGAGPGAHPRGPGSGAVAVRPPTSSPGW